MDVVCFTLLLVRVLLLASLVESIDNPLLHRLLYQVIDRAVLRVHEPRKHHPARGRVSGARFLNPAERARLMQLGILLLVIYGFRLISNVLLNLLLFGRRYIVI